VILHQDWIGVKIFKNFADQDWIGFNFIGSGLDSDWKISQSAHLCYLPKLYTFSVGRAFEEFFKGYKDRYRPP